MQRRATWSEAYSFGIILPTDISHEFSHTVSMVIRRLESVLSNQPSWWEYHEIHRGSSEYHLIYPSIADLLVRTVKIEGSG